MCGKVLTAHEAYGTHTVDARLCRLGSVHMRAKGTLRYRRRNRRQARPQVVVETVIRLGIHPGDPAAAAAAAATAAVVGIVVVVVRYASEANLDGVVDVGGALEKNRGAIQRPSCCYRAGLGQRESFI